MQRPTSRRMALAIVALAPGAAFAACGEPTPLESAQAACEEACDASASSGCGPELEREACLAGCDASVRAADPSCYAELTTVLECTAEHPCEVEDACPDVRAAYYECTLGSECRAFCDASVEAGCGFGGCEELCLARSRAQIVTNPYVDALYGDVLACAASEGVTCSDGAPTASGCEEASEVLDGALDNGDFCDGWCSLAESLGCAESCATCRGQQGQSCVVSYARLALCTLAAVDAAGCEAGELVPGPSCASESEAYEACLASE